VPSARLAEWLKNAPAALLEQLRGGATGTQCAKKLTLALRSAVVEPKPEVDAEAASWAQDGPQDFSLSLPLGETMVLLTTDDTKGDRLSLATDAPAVVSVPSTWTGEGAGSGANLSARIEVELQR